MSATRILVIDNDATIREMIGLILGDDGYEVFNSTFPDVNLDVVRAVNPALIILDLNIIQRGAGWAFLQLLKMEDNTAVIPVLICTTTTKLSSEIGGYLTAHNILIVRKPFDLYAFVEVVKQALLADNLTVPPVFRKQPILIVEDDATLRLLMTTILELEGYRVDSAANGLLALDALAHGQYSMILLDMAMPVMDGSQFLAAYMLQEGWHIPIVLISGQAGLMIEKFPSLVKDSLSKPFETGDLLRVVSKFAEPVPGTLGLHQV
jgi:CheY-like chemotaxis protein